MSGGDRFAGRTAVVTGAGSGIGWETARLLAEEGAAVYAADLDPSGIPPGTQGAKADVSVAADIEGVVTAAVEATGRLDIMVNNAGIGSISDPLSCTEEEWDLVFAVNARGVFLGTRAALGPMLAKGSGVIVNTASIAGLVGLPDRAAYCASKGAVIAFTRAVAVQYAAAGIRCCCVAPGTVDSPWVGRLLAGAPDPVATREKLVARQPMGRLAQPVEVAKAICYLASDDAAFVTGEALVIDGGLVAG